MTREKEDELLAELSRIRLERRKLIRRIVQARAVGRRDDEAISELEALSALQLELTEPRLETAVAWPSTWEMPDMVATGG